MSLPIVLGLFRLKEIQVTGIHLFPILLSLPKITVKKKSEFPMILRERPASQNWGTAYLYSSPHSTKGPFHLIILN